MLQRFAPLVPIVQPLFHAGLETAVGNYNKFVGSFERNVLSAGRRLREKHIEIGKRELDEVPLVENAPRYGAGDGPAMPQLVDTANDEDARDVG